MKYYFKIEDPEELKSSWSDENALFMAWTFDQNTIEECINIDGVFYATYESMELSEEKEFKYLSYQQNRGVEQENLIQVTLPAGEYGVREFSLTLQDIS